MHGIACVLQQVRTCFQSQPVGHLFFLLVALKVTPDVFEFDVQAVLIPPMRVGFIYLIALNQRVLIALNQRVDAAAESIPSSSALSLPPITPIVMERRFYIERRYGMTQPESCDWICRR